MSTTTFTENNGSYAQYYSSWTIDLSVAGMTISPNNPINIKDLISIYASHTCSQLSKNYATLRTGVIRAYDVDDVYLAEIDEGFAINNGTEDGRIYWSENTSKRVPFVGDSSDGYIRADDLFYDINPDTTHARFYIKIGSIHAESAVTSGTGKGKNDKAGWGEVLSEDTSSLILWADAWLNAPPLWDVTDPGGIYAPGDPFTVTVSNLTAQCDGHITECELGFDGLSTTVSSISGGQMTISVPTTVGQYQPYIWVRDSRGQSSTQYLSRITVRNNTVSVSSASATRVDSAGKKNDSGTYAMIQATFNRLNSTFLSPTVAYGTVGSSTRTSVSGTWYTSWTASGGFSNAVSNWSSLANGTTLYFKANGTYAKTTTYMFYITPRATATEGDTITGAIYSTYLSQEFFLISGRRGGKGLGIGQKASADKLQIGIPTEIVGSLSVLNGLGQLSSIVDLIYPVGSYYETSKANFNPNTYWGGTWELEPAGRVNISGASSGTYTVPNTGGSTTASGSGSVPVPYHNHTGNSFTISGQANSDGTHEHKMKWQSDAVEKGTGGGRVLSWDTSVTGTSNKPTSSAGSHTHSLTGTATGSTSYAGSTDAKVTISVSTIQPWRAVYRWHRTK